MPTTEPTTQVRILVCGHGGWEEELHRWCSEPNVRVEHVNTWYEALEALRRGLFSSSYDLVVAPAWEFTAAGSLDAFAANAVLDHMSQAVSLSTAAGDPFWENPGMKALPEEVRQRVRQLSRDAIAELSASQSSTSPAASGKRRVPLTLSSGDRYEVSFTPIRDPNQRLTHVAAVVWEAGSPGRLQEKIDAIDQAGRELLHLDSEQFSRLEAQERIALLEQKTIRCIRDVLHFDNFEIYVLDRSTNRLDPVMYWGVPQVGERVEQYAVADGNGIGGFVAARKRSYICPDTSQDARYLPGIENAKSSLTVPLFHQDRVVGVANFESTRLAAFSEDDRQFAEIFGRYVALALHLLELLVCERRTAAGQIGKTVLGEITAPLNDILTDLETLVEDYIGHDDLRKRLRGVSENVLKIRETIKDVTAGKPGVVGARAAASRRRDPALDGKRVLLADDEDVIRDTVRDVLTGFGCTVCTASDGACALDLLEKQSFDLVLSDIRMPLKNGYEVFAAAKKANPATPVILTTGFGYDPNHSIVRARREGLAAVLFKPFKVDQLLAEIHAALKAAPH